MSNSSDFQSRNSRFGGHASLAVAHQQYFVNTNGNGGLETPNHIMWRAANAEAASMLSNWTHQLLQSNHNAFVTGRISDVRDESWRAGEHGPCTSCGTPKRGPMGVLRPFSCCWLDSQRRYHLFYQWQASQMQFGTEKIYNRMLQQQVSALGGGTGRGVDQAPANFDGIEQTLDADGSDALVADDSGSEDQPSATHGTLDRPPATIGIVDQPPVTDVIVDQPPVTDGIVDQSPVTEDIVDQPPFTDGIADRPPIIDGIVDQAPITDVTVDLTLGSEGKVVDLPENLDNILLLPSPPASPPPTTEAHRPTPTIATRVGNVRAKDWGISTSSVLGKFASCNSASLTAGPHMLSSDERLHGSVVIRLNIEKGLNGNIPTGQTAPKLIKAAIKKIVEGLGGHEEAFGSAENPGILRGMQVTNRCVDLTLEFSARGNAAMISLLSQQSVTIEIDGKEHFVPLLPSISVRGLRGSTRVLIKHPSLSSISKRGITETLLKAAGYRVGQGDAYSVIVVGEHLGLAGKHDPFLPEGTPLSDTIVAWVIPPINDPHLLNIPFRFKWMDATGNFLIKGDPTAPKKQKPQVVVPSPPLQPIGPAVEVQEAEVLPEPQVTALPPPLQPIGSAGEVQEAELPSEPQVAVPSPPLQPIGQAGEVQETELPSKPQGADPPPSSQPIGPAGDVQEAELSPEPQVAVPPPPLQPIGPAGEVQKAELSPEPQVAVPSPLSQPISPDLTPAPHVTPLTSLTPLVNDLTSSRTLRPFSFLRSPWRPIGLGSINHKEATATPEAVATQVTVDAFKPPPPIHSLQVPSTIEDDEDTTLPLPPSTYRPPHASTPMVVEAKAYVPPHARRPKGKPHLATPRTTPQPSLDPTQKIPPAPLTAPLPAPLLAPPSPLPISLDEFIELRSSTLESFISKGLGQITRNSSHLASNSQRASHPLPPRPLPPPPPPHRPPPPRLPDPPPLTGPPLPFINPSGTSMVTIKNQQDERARRQGARKWQEAISRALDKLVAATNEEKMPNEEKTRISHAILSDETLLLCLDILSPPMNDSELPNYLIDKLTSFVSGRSFGKGRSIKRGQGYEIRHQIDDNKVEVNKRAKISKAGSAKIRGCPGP